MSSESEVEKINNGAVRENLDMLARNDAVPISVWRSRVCTLLIAVQFYCASQEALTQIAKLPTVLSLTQRNFSNYTHNSLLTARSWRYAS